jgi:hypothetical protein
MTQLKPRENVNTTSRTTEQLGVGSGEDAARDAPKGLPSKCCAFRGWLVSQLQDQGRPNGGVLTDVVLRLYCGARLMVS